MEAVGRLRPLPVSSLATANDTETNSFHSGISMSLYYSGARILKNAGSVILQ